MHKYSRPYVCSLALTISFWGFLFRAASNPMPLSFHRKLEWCTLLSVTTLADDFKIAISTCAALHSLICPKEWIYCVDCCRWAHAIFFLAPFFLSMPFQFSHLLVSCTKKSRVHLESVRIPRACAPCRFLVGNGRSLCALLSLMGLHASKCENNMPSTVDRQQYQP